MVKEVAWVRERQLTTVASFPGCTAQLSAANSLFPLNYSSASLIGQPWFHPVFLSNCTSSASLFVEWSIMSSREKEKKNLVTKCHLKTFPCSRNHTANWHPLHILETVQSDCTKQMCGSGSRSWAQRVCSNSGSARDRLIARNSSDLFFFFFSHWGSLLLCVI